MMKIFAAAFSPEISDSILLQPSTSLVKAERSPEEEKVARAERSPEEEKFMSSSSSSNKLLKNKQKLRQQVKNFGNKLDRFQNFNKALEELLASSKFNPSDLACLVGKLQKVEQNSSNWIDVVEGLYKHVYDAPEFPDIGELINIAFEQDIRYVRVVMFVCTGNTCRSPMAEHLLKDIMRKMDIPIFVRSRARELLPDDKVVHRFAVQAFENRKIKSNIAQHQARQLTQRDVDSAHKIYLINDTDQEMFVAENGKLSPLKVTDPYHGEQELYDKTLTSLDAKVYKIAIAEIDRHEMKSGPGDE